LASGRVELSHPDGFAFVRKLAAPNVQTSLLHHPDGDPTGPINSWSPHILSTPPKSFLLASCALLLVNFWIHLAPFCLFAHYSHIPESCMQAVHRAEFARGPREIEQPLEPRSWIAQSLPSGMWSALTLWWHPWIVFMTLSRLISGGIFTLVPVLSSPGLSDTSMPT